MRLLALDTSGYSAMMRGGEEAVGIIREHPHVILSPVVTGELEYGFLGGRKVDWNMQILNRFLSSDSVSVTPITRDTATRYASIHRYLKKSGTPLPANDIWIAAGAMEHGATLMTADRHFEKIPQVLSRILERAS